MTFNEALKCAYNAREHGSIDSYYVLFNEKEYSRTICAIDLDGKEFVFYDDRYDSGHDI